MREICVAGSNIRKNRHAAAGSAGRRPTSCNAGHSKGPGWRSAAAGSRTESECCGEEYWSPIDELQRWSQPGAREGDLRRRRLYLEQADRRPGKARCPPLSCITWP
ncbi:hypothetical protein QO009_004055 [Brevibacillus aydinogluensis]|uniref:hypothetical protein n=1 Tax=Brevibacillus aydinogluensis TaxID=927786 RepID=UPI0028929AAE|nr:hypothetical protein [Brevibacillus aydinogluensis]MDT3418130.1 hypothetical protein [Brevibacillus aydinogluensis]